MGKQTENLKNITSRYEHVKKYWAAAVNDLQEKIKVNDVIFSVISYCNNNFTYYCCHEIISCNAFYFDFSADNEK